MELTDEQRAIRSLVRTIAIEELRPSARAADQNQAFPEAIWDRLGELDLTALAVPERHGGLEADRTTIALVNEWLAYGHMAVATALSVHCLAVTCILEFGSTDLRETWLPEMATGRPVGAFALSEPHAGSDPSAMSTIASREDDEYVITGSKQWITNGSRAGVFIVFAKTDPDDPESVTQFLVPSNADGITVSPPESKLGLRASDTVPIDFSGVRIPSSNRLGYEGGGLSSALSVLTGGRIAIASQAVGVAQAALDDAVEYAKAREQFDRPIASIQTIQHRIAEMETRLQAARLLTREAASIDDAGEDSRYAASKAKYFASENAVWITGQAVQIHGGAGYTTEFDVERYYRDAKVTTIYEGTSQIQKTIIASGLLQ